MANDNAKINLPALSARQLVTATLVVGLVVLAFALLFRFYNAILLLLAGIIISLALAPVVERLRARGLGPGTSVALLYGLLFILVLIFLRFGAPLIINQSATIGAQLREGYFSIVESLQNTNNILIRRLAESLPAEPTMPPAAVPAPAEGEESPSPFASVSRYLGLGALVIFDIWVIFVVAFFWTVESERIERSAILLLPIHQRETVREFIVEAKQRVGGYVNGQLLLSLIMGVLAMIAYFIIGLPYAPALGLFVGIMEIIPLIGPVIGAVPALIIGFTESPQTAMWTVVASLVIHQLESNFFGPRVMKRTLGIRPLVTLMALTAFGTLFGVLGAIIALPLASVLQLIFDRLFIAGNGRADSNVERDQLGLLRYETQEVIDDLRKTIRKRESERPADELEEETVEDSLEAIALDLDSLLAQLREPEVAE